MPGFNDTFDKYAATPAGERFLLAGAVGAGLAFGWTAMTLSVDVCRSIPIDAADILLVGTSGAALCVLAGLAFAAVEHRQNNT